MTKRVETHHYKESGLPYVFLEGVKKYYCSCGEWEVEIPRPGKIEEKLSQTIVEKSPCLNGAEIRFLRKHLEFSVKDFAYLLGVHRVTVSRWENNQVKIDKCYDSIIRALIASKGLPSILLALKIAKKKSRSHRYTIRPSKLYRRQASAA
jgi:putative zinc finger/helix-turn-helix YgiT family protein